MDMEDIENQLEDRNVVMKAGYNDLESYEAFKHDAAEGLLKFGGTFARALAAALMTANLEDSLKIMRYWHSLCHEHAMLYKMFVAKEDAKGGCA